MSDGATQPLVRGNTAFLTVSQCEKIDLNTLAALYLANIRRVVIEPLPGGDQPDCVPLEQLDQIVRSRGLRPLTLRLADREALAAWWREMAKTDAPDPGRRGFLAGLARPVSDTLSEQETDAGALTEIQATNADRPGALFAFAPVIQPDRCTGCDACVNVCPLDVLILVKDEEGDPCYDLLAQSCDGCGLCVDVCDVDAIKLTEMAEKPGEMLLDAFICRDCGVGVHEPRGHASGDGLCRICRQTGHKKKLFQVLT